MLEALRCSNNFIEKKTFPIEGMRPLKLQQDNTSAMSVSVYRIVISKFQ